MKRIQRKRTKGWRMPENAVYVGRPTKWGNPFAIDRLSDRRSREIAVATFRGFVLSQIANGVGYPLRELRGKDLACWCKEGEPCHADVLIELANSNEAVPYAYPQLAGEQETPK